MANIPIPQELLDLIDQLTQNQLSWLSGYAWSKSTSSANQLLSSNSVPQVATRKITILSASQTGNARGVAEDLEKFLQSKQIPVSLIATGDYKSKNIENEDIVILVCSTQGEGDPPEEAIPLFKLLYGKKAPNLAKLSYAILALGDRSYPDFCQAGRLFDERFKELGATTLLPRVDCDIDYAETAKHWQEEITQILSGISQSSTNISTSHSNIPTTNSPVNLYTKQNPLTAKLSVRQKITSRFANKDVEHIEIEVSEDLQYFPGDALGIWFSNDEKLVDEILAACHFNGNENIRLADGSFITIRQALLEHDEITQNSPQFVKAIATLASDEDLLHKANNPPEVQKIVDNEPILSLLKKYPVEISPQNLHEHLRPLTPRLYSIASSQLEVGNEVHLTVGVLRYEHEGQIFTGGASGFLGERLQEDEAVRVYVEPNPRFRLPENPETPIIMIGSGTGIAPFRAFMQERENLQASGKNWLAFGNQKFTDDFLYQLEWQNWHKMGLLTDTSFAWSRENPEKKVYVQDKLKEQAEKLWEWLESGAYVYVCGDASKMAKDIEQTILTIIEQQGKKSSDDAEEYLNTLREENRYLRDVY